MHMRGNKIMRNVRKLLIAIIAAVMMLADICPVQAKKISTQDGLPIHFETEADGLPDYTDGYEMHGISDEDAEEIESMFSEEDWAKFNKDMDMFLDFEPVSNSDAASLFSNVEKFRASGGVGAFLESGRFEAGAAIGLTANKTDKVRVLGQDTNASDWVYVVDKDATCFVIKDEAGNPIPHAQVTISYIDENKERVTSSIITTDGQKQGIAVFAGLPESFNGILDIQADGYHAISVLDRYLEAGETYIYALSEASDNELYIRGSDLDGKDIFFEETDISLVDMDTEDMPLRVIVSKTGDVSLPASIEIYSESRGKTVLTMDQSSAYEYDSQTRVYTAEKRWVEQKAGLLVDGDIVAVRAGGFITRLEHFTVKNARETPRIGNTEMPFTASQGDADITNRMGGAGWLNFTVQIIKVPVTFGVFPDGTFIIMASFDITNLDQNTQYKYSSLFDKSWQPKLFSNYKNILETFQKSFWQNAQKVHSGKTKLNSKDKVWLLTNKTYDIGMSFSAFIKLNYNEETDDHYGTGGFVFSLNFMGGLTEYFVFFAGPVAIPLYIGFEFSVGIKIALSFNIFTETPPDGEAYAKKWKYTDNGSYDVNNRIEAIGNLDVFGGVGIKGVLGANANGYFTVDVAAVLGQGPANVFTADPHTFVDLLWGLKINWYLLFLSGQIKLQCTNWAKRIYDNWGEHDLSTEDLQVVFKELSLESCADELIPVNESGDTDPAYTIANNSVMLSESIKNVDAYTYPDNQTQFVAAKDYTALFRIVADGAQTHLVYQYQDPQTGDILPTVYQVQIPEDKSVSEFVAVPNKSQLSDPKYCNYAYIGAVLADNTVEDLSERAKTSEVAAIVVDLKDKKTVVSEIASDPKDSGKYLYSAPRPAGMYYICDVEYAATRIEDCQNSQQLLETITAGMQDISLTTTRNIISYRDINDQEHRQYTGIENGKVFSTGSAMPLEPTYWVIDPIRSTNKTLVIKGYEADGKCTEDLKHYFQLDISDLDIQDFNYEPVLSNWMYMNGCNYFIAGDTVYWLRKSSTDPVNYTWIAEPVENGEGMVSTDGRYTMFTNNNQSAVYIVGVVDSYDIDVEDWSETKSNNTLKLHTLITEEEYGKLTCKLHGPLEFGFAKGDRLTNFTAAYNPDKCESKGMSIVYSTPIDANRSVYSPLAKNLSAPETAVNTKTDINEAIQADDEDNGDWEPEYDKADEAATLRLWKQEAERGMRVTDVQIPDYVFRNNQPYVVTNVTVRNYGYAKEGPVMFIATDENGNRLGVSDSQRDLDEYDYFFSKVLYTGDSTTIPVYIKPHSSWEAGSEHEITVEVLPAYYYDGNMDDIVNSAVMTADNMTLTAENTLIGDRHYVSLTIANNTFVSEKTPKILAEFRYTDPSKDHTRTYTMPTNESLLKYDGDDEVPVDLVYSFALDMDQVWKDGLKEGLQGIHFSLVDDEGMQQSNEVIYVVNPEEVMKDMITGTKLDEDGNPLPGASIGLFAEGSSEAVQTAVSDENGQFFFSGLDEGSYIVREIQAPEGYVLDETEYPVNAQGTGEVFEIEMTNRIIRGNVRVNLTDLNDKNLSGAVIAVYQGEELIGKLSEKADGTYELAGLPYGEYTLKIEKLPDGYKAYETYTVRITEDGAVVVINIKAARTETGAPDTRDSNKLSLYAGLLICSLAVIILILRRRKALKEAD